MLFSCLEAMLNSWPDEDIAPLGLSVMCQELPINNGLQRLDGGYIKVVWVSRSVYAAQRGCRYVFSQNGIQRF